MTIEEAIKLRHSVRRYLPKPLTTDQEKALQKKINDLNQQHHLHIQLIINEEEAFNCFMASYGKFHGVKNYIAIVAKKEKNMEERSGRAVAELVLYSQTLGLNTCIVGKTYKKTKEIIINSNETLVMLISLGYGENQGVSHPMKPISKIAPNYDSSPDWFKKGIDSVLLAPTALNLMNAVFMINEDGKVIAKSKIGVCRKENLGIMKYFFELGSKKKITS
jgi:hypothetical protein